MPKFQASAFEHGITEDQIEEVLANRWGTTKWFQIHDDGEGNSQDMAAGFDAEGCPIEIGITYRADDEVIFHADSVTSVWEVRYNEDS